MPYIIATYKRQNFDTKPTMSQVCDVLFHTDYDGEYDMSGYDPDGVDRINPHYLPEQVDHDLGIAAKAQLGDTFKLPFPDLEWGGWSSVMLDKVVLIEDPLDSIVVTEPVEASPQIGETFTHGVSRYRISAFYKEYVSTRVPCQFTAELLAKIRAEEPVNPYHVGKRRIKLMQCLPSEATFVSGSGIAGCLVPLDDITITGLVNWDARTLARMRLDYNKGIQREYDSGEFPHLTEKWIKDDTGVDS